MQCLSDEIVANFVGAKLPPKDIAPIDAHLDSCEDCRTLVAALAGTLSESNSSAPLAPAPKFGRYVVLDVLGQGAMGIVYAAYDPKLDRKIAIKLLHAEKDESKKRLGPSRQERFLREAKAMARLVHPNVVTVHDTGTAEDSVFVAMEYVDGLNLRQWLDDSPRDTAAIIDAFKQAGTGLAAAHNAGIVHRDFKPDNVFVASEGAVKVGDFGLVSLAGAGGVASIESEDYRIARGSGVDTSSSNESATGENATLTQTGTLLGTALYMSPEQFNAVSVGPAADQFSFCVAFYEALYGAPPFARGVRSTYSELRTSVLTGAVNTPSEASNVPVWLRAVVMRGLSQDPGQRYPDMGALLIDLENNNESAHKRRRSGLLIFGAAALLCTGAVFAFGSSTNDSDPCENAAKDMSTTWNAEVAEHLRNAVLTSQKANAAVTVERLTSAAGDYAHGWSSMREQACRATHVSHTQSDHLMDLRMQCLDSKRVALESRLNVLIESGVEPSVVDRAVSAVLQLPALSACADPDALTAVLPLPQDATKRQEIATLERQLARLHALDLAGKLEQARELAAKVSSESSEIDYPPVRALALLRLANLDVQDDNPNSAIKKLREAAKAAAVARDDNLTVEIWLKLLWAVVVVQERYEELPTLQLAVESSVARSTHPQKWQAKLQNILGAVSRHQGNYEDAHDRYQQSLALFAEAPDTLELDTAMVLNNLGVVARRLGNYEEARGYLEQAIEISERVYGSPHPEIARALNSLGVLARYEGDYAKANEHYSRSLEMKEKLLGPEHDSVATALNNLGTLKNVEGKPQEAAPYYERALAIWETVHGPDHTAVATALVNLGEVSNDAGSYRKAIELCGRSLRIFEQRIGLDNPDLAWPLNCLSAAYMDLGEGAKAIPLLRRAIKLQSTESGNLGLLASSQLELARLLWAEKSRRQDATVLAQQAAANFGLAGKAGAEGLAESTKWLEDRDLPLPKEPAENHQP